MEEKYLTASDITGNFSVPSRWLRILPEFGEGHMVVVRAVDGTDVQWAFHCCIRRGRYNKPYFQSQEWLLFVGQKQLTVGDKILIMEEEHPFLGPRYRIRAEKRIEGLWVDVDASNLKNRY